MAWLVLGAAIVSEVGGTVALRYSDGFRRLVPTLLVALGYGLSFWLLALALRHLPLSLAYAVWAGVGTALVAVVGVLALDEPLGWLKVAGLLLIVGGVVALRISSAE